MNRQSTHRNISLPRVCILLLALSFSLSAVAATPVAAPKGGGYCPAPGILLIVAEELSTSLDLAMGSRTAISHKNRAMAVSELIAAGTALHLAASRGAAARTSLLIDAIEASKANEDYSQVLTWFPLLHTSLMTLPHDDTASIANDLIGSAEGIMQGDKKGDPMVPLKEARHMLACDGLDIPLQQAIAEQGKLISTLGVKTKAGAYDTLLDSLRRALAYALENGRKDTRSMEIPNTGPTS